MLMWQLGEECHHPALWHRGFTHASLVGPSLSPYAERNAHWLLATFLTGDRGVCLPLLLTCNHVIQQKEPIVGHCVPGAFWSWCRGAGFDVRSCQRGIWTVWTVHRLFVSRSEAENILPFFLSLAELVWNEVSVQVISDGHGSGLQ